MAFIAAAKERRLHPDHRPAGRGAKTAKRNTHGAAASAAGSQWSPLALSPKIQAAKAATPEAR